MRDLPIYKQFFFKSVVYRDTVDVSSMSLFLPPKNFSFLESVLGFFSNMSSALRCHSFY